MTKYVAWVDGNECLDPECNAVGNSTWDSRAIYCSDKCFTADGHMYTPMAEDSHERLGYWPSDYCEHCASCETKVTQGINCTFECDAECIAILEGE
jgi:hypothetical protein